MKLDAATHFLAPRWLVERLIAYLLFDTPVGWLLSSEHTFSPFSNIRQQQQQLLMVVVVDLVEFEEVSV